MEKINLTFLGTGDSIPTKKRSHTAIFLTYKNENILIDCGEGTQRQFKIAKTSPSKISKIFITHLHGDHVLGLPGLLQTLHMNNYTKTLEIYGPKGTKTFVSKLKDIFQLKINLKVHEISSGIAYETKDLEISAAQMNHGTPALAYAFKVKDKLRLDKAKLKTLGLPHSPLLKKLQAGKSIKFKGKTIKPSQVAKGQLGQRVVFILDTATNPNAIKISKSADLLVCESTFANAEKEKASRNKHLTAEQAATIAKKAKVKALVLTHISQRYDSNPEKILNEAKKVFKNTSIVKDFDKLTI